MLEDGYHAFGEESEDVTERAAAYERWVSDILRPTLEGYSKRILTVEEECSHYAELISKLEEIMSREEHGPLEMLTDLGADCLVKVKVEDPSMVFVHVALGFHVEFTLQEAVRFAATKKSRLTSQVQELKKREAEVKKDLKAALSMVEELRALDPGADRG